MGKRKIEIKKIEKESNRQVTFSKRKMGVFKKASELSVMFGVEIGVILVSPGNKYFAFGSHDIDYVLDKFQNGHGDLDGDKMRRLRALEHECNALSQHVEDLKEQTQDIKRRQSEFDKFLFGDQYNDDLHLLFGFPLHDLLAFRDRLCSFRQQAAYLKQQFQGPPSSSSTYTNISHYANFLSTVKEENIIGCRGGYLFQGN